MRSRRKTNAKESKSAPAPTCEHGGAFWDAIGDEMGSLAARKEVINADVLDAWFPPAPRLIHTLKEHLDWIVRTSPPTGCEGMTRSIARARGVDPRCVLAGDGSSSLIFLSFHSWLSRSSRVLLLDPTYGEYGHLLERVLRCKVDRLQLDPGRDFELELPALARSLKKGYDLVVLVNPNSPTGRYAAREQLQPVLRKAPGRTRVWIDETYVEYAGEEASLESFAARSSNVIVCKSMSKVYALSGLRAGYLCASPGALESLRSRMPPWAVSLPGQIAAVVALEEIDYYKARWRETHRLREQLGTALKRELGLETLPSVTNFMLCMLPLGGMTAAELSDSCRAEGLFLRELSRMSPVLGPGAFRIAVKDKSTNQKMLRILGRVLRGGSARHGSRRERPSS